MSSCRQLIPCNLCMHRRCVKAALRCALLCEASGRTLQILRSLRMGPEVHLAGQVDQHLLGSEVHAADAAPHFSIAGGTFCMLALRLQLNVVIRSPAAPDRATQCCAQQLDMEAAQPACLHSLLYVLVLTVRQAADVR